MSGKLKRNAGGFRDLGMIRRVRQKDAGAFAIHANVVQHGSEVFVLRCMAVWNADNLQAVGQDFFIGEYADSGGLDRAEIFAVVSKLFVIPGDKVDAMWSSELAQGLLLRALRRWPCRRTNRRQ